MRNGTASGGRPSLPVVAALAFFAAVAGAGSATAQDRGEASGRPGAYVGVFAGWGALDVRLLDEDGFTAADSSPGQTFDYDDAGSPVGVVAGWEFIPRRTAIRVELDGLFGGLPAAARQVDPVGRDETAASELRWAATARVGVRRSLGHAGAFLSGGVAAAGISASFTDLDLDSDGRMYVDRDDSFAGRSTRVGWVAGAGLEVPLGDLWTLRLEAMRMDFGESVDEAPNVMGVNAGVCGPAGLPSPCEYRIDHRFDLARLVVVRRLGR
ncbi:MAG: outer membrane beta-barrel protein [Acidobacteria bacterium]|nr:outer membrane beta-barrel protein [Acidobacteriota bacterium]